MRIMIAMPTDRYIETECFQSIFNMDKCGHEVDLITVCKYSVDEARNMLSKHAIENGYDYILWVDADVIVPKDTIEKFIKSGKEIIAGLYSYKVLTRNEVVCLKKVGDRYGNYKADKICELKEILEVDAFGFGCVFMSVDVLKHLTEPYFVFKNDLGEDIYFCEKAKKAGYKLYADPTVLCGHIGYINYSLRGSETV